MNASGALNAAIGFLITLGTALIALWSGEGVSTFADISTVEYAVALVGSTVTALTTYRAKMSEAPTNKSEAPTNE